MQTFTLRYGLRSLPYAGDAVLFTIPKKTSTRIGRLRLFRLGLSFYVAFSPVSSRIFAVFLSAATFTRLASKMALLLTIPHGLSGDCVSFAAHLCKPGAVTCIIAIVSFSVFTFVVDALS